MRVSYSSRTANQELSPDKVYPASQGSFQRMSKFFLKVFFYFPTLYTLYWTLWRAPISSTVDCQLAALH